MAGIIGPGRMKKAKKRVGHGGNVPRHVLPPRKGTARPLEEMPLMPNPGALAKRRGMAARIREACGEDGELIVRVARDILIGKIRASARDRLAAGALLSDRGWGKTVETHMVGALSPEASSAASELTASELRSLAQGASEGVGALVEGSIVPEPLALPAVTDR